MGDERLRELERRFKATGASADEAAWLRARVQAGDLAERLVRLAAHLGHEPARRALELPNPAPSAVSTWVREIGAYDPLGLIRAVVAVAPMAIELDARRPEFDQAVLKTVIEPWVCRPDDPALRAAAKACALRQATRPTLRSECVRALLVQITEFGAHVPPAEEERNTRKLLEVPVSVARSARPFPLPAHLRGVVMGVGGPGPTPEQRAELDRLETRNRREATRLVWRLVRDEVSPWALGTGDPVRERVEARRREAAGE